jgi:hypothetical protein
VLDLAVLLGHVLGVAGPLHRGGRGRQLDHLPRGLDRLALLLRLLLLPLLLLLIQVAQQLARRCRIDGLDGDGLVAGRDRAAAGRPVQHQPEQQQQVEVESRRQQQRVDETAPAPAHGTYLRVAKFDTKAPGSRRRT